jgi:hypothetical protein
MSEVIDYARLKELSKELRRPMGTLIVTRRDPFAAGTTGRKANAEWFAGVWRTMHLRIGAHIRRVHYRLISQPIPILMPSGVPFLNTERCWEFLIDASLDARYLELVPNFTVDRRNALPMINMVEGSSGVTVPRGGIQIEMPIYDAPLLKLVKPQIAQRYVIEIWCEKSTINDILVPLGERFGVNIVTGIGELSHPRCVELVERARESKLPVRVLYASDFDPGGDSMPVAVSRKIEFELYRRRLDLDIQVRPVVLTYDQCQDYRLPRTPIKDTETRAARFEERFGEGGTELDALEALHEGELANILEREIMRYYDPTLERCTKSVAVQVGRDLTRASATICRRHAGDISALAAEHKRLTALLKASERRTAPIMRRIERALADAAPALDDYSWPEPRQGNEDPNPLFDSRRDYIEQINRYKEHQGKPTERRGKDEYMAQVEKFLREKKGERA